MILVKKEFLDVKVGNGKLTLGELNQNQLESFKKRFGDKYFEVEKKEKKKKIKEQENYGLDA